MKLEARERLAKYGAETLSDAELLTVLIGDKAVKFEDCDNSALEAVYNTFDAVKSRGALTELETCRIMAGVELGLRIATVNANDKPSASHPQALANYLMPRMQLYKQEKFVVVFLNARNYITGSRIVTSGTLNNTTVHPREVFAPAITNNAAAIAIAHNHPSGISNPSKEDIELTHTLINAGKIIGIPVIDHIIIGHGSYYSFVENGCMKSDTTP